MRGLGVHVFFWQQNNNLRSISWLKSTKLKNYPETLFSSCKVWQLQRWENCLSCTKQKLAGLKTARPNQLWATYGQFWGAINRISLSTFRVHENKNALSKNIPTHYVPACHIVSSTPCLIHPLFSSTTWFFSAFCAHISTCLGASFKLALVFCKKEQSGGTLDWPFMLCTLNGM